MEEVQKNEDKKYQGFIKGAVKEKLKNDKANAYLSRALAKWARPLAASFCSEKFGSKISEYNIIGLNIFISQSGDLNVSIKFENPDALKNFENNYINIIADLKGSLVFKENNFVGVCTFTYEKEAASTEM